MFGEKKKAALDEKEHLAKCSAWGWNYSASGLCACCCTGRRYTDRKRRRDCAKSLQIVDTIMKKSVKEVKLIQNMLQNTPRPTSGNRK